MDYGMSELVPIVGKLAEKYTGHEHTSISYEKAEQLKEKNWMLKEYIYLENIL